MPTPRFLFRPSARLAPLALAALCLGGTARAQSLQELYEAARGFDAAYLSARALADSAQYKVAQSEAVKNGTKLARANFACLMSGAPVSGDYIKAEGKAKRMGARLMAIVAEGTRGRVYLAPTAEHEAAARKAKPEWKPDVEFFQQALGFRVGNYGMTKWSDLFTARQLVALTTISDLVRDACEQAKRAALAAGNGRQRLDRAAAGQAGAVANRVEGQAQGQQSKAHRHQHAREPVARQCAAGHEMAA